MGRIPVLTTFRTGDEVQDRNFDHIKQTLNPVLRNPLLAAADFRWMEIAATSATGTPTFALQYRTQETWATIATFTSTGAVSQPLGRAHLSVATSLPSGAATVINYDTKDEDSEGAITTGAAWKYMCKRAGLYALTATAGIGGAVGAAGAIFPSIALNGSEKLRGPRQAGPAIGQPMTLLVAGQVRLALNDFVQITLFHNSGSTETTETAAAVNHFEIVRVSS